MSSIGKYFDSWADFTPELRELPYFVTWLFDRIVENIDFRDGLRVLDLGTGNGILLRRLQAENKRMDLVGLDVSKGMIKKAREMMRGPGIRFVLGSMDDTDLDDNSVDYVVSNQAVHHVKDKRKLFTEIHRILKDGGRIVISDHFITDYDNEKELEYRKRILSNVDERDKESFEFAKSYLNAWGDLTEEQRSKHPPEYHTSPEEMADIMNGLGFETSIIRSPIECMAIVVGDKKPVE